MGKFSALLLVGCAVSFGSAGYAASVDDARSTARSSGTLTGTVTLGSKIAARRMKFSLYPDPNRGATRRRLRP